MVLTELSLNPNLVTFWNLAVYGRFGYPKAASHGQQKGIEAMSQELAQGQNPWRNSNESSGKAALKSASQGPSLVISAPPSDLFLPENRQKLLQHLIQNQFPAIRDLVAKLLENGFFLLDPADVSFTVIRRAILEADEYIEQNPYWDWIRSVATVSIHETVMATEEGTEEEIENPVTQPDELRNQLMRKVFNRLPLEQRRALYHVAVMGQCLEDAARSTGEDPEELRSHAREGLRKVLEGIESEERGETHV